MTNNPDWWQQYTYEEQRAYLKQHPDSVLKLKFRTQDADINTIRELSKEGYLKKGSKLRDDLAFNLDREVEGFSDYLNNYNESDRILTAIKDLNTGKTVGDNDQERLRNMFKDYHKWAKGLDPEQLGRSHSRALLIAGGILLAPLAVPALIAWSGFKLLKRIGSKPTEPDLKITRSPEQTEFDYYPAPNLPDNLPVFIDGKRLRPIESSLGAAGTAIIVEFFNLLKDFIKNHIDEKELGLFIQKMRKK
jgi:hypothetical protein